MLKMPIEFDLFENFCNQHGYKAADQRQDKIPSNIYAIRTRNGVKVEIKVTKKITSYVAGFGLNSEKLELLRAELENQGMTILKDNPTFMYIKFQDDILAGFLTLIKYIEEIDAIAQRKAGARLGIETKPDEAYLFIAETLQNAIKRGQPWAISRGFGGFDTMDNAITMGHSINGREQERSGRNAYREHIVPCDFQMREGIRMFAAGATVDEVAAMFKANNHILMISDEEANLLDNVLGLRTVMPTGWEFGHDVYARITAAGIQLETSVDK
jgi:hypothetical protein